MGVIRPSLLSFGSNLVKLHQEMVGGVAVPSVLLALGSCTLLLATAKRSVQMTSTIVQLAVTAEEQAVTLELVAGSNR